MNTRHRLALSPTRRATLKRYGLDEEDLYALLELQGNACAICRRSFTPTRPPCVDHDHRPPAPTRGLLCHFCNRDVLGVLGDDPDFYRRAADFLENPPAARLPGPPRRAPNAVPTNERSNP